MLGPSWTATSYNGTFDNILLPDSNVNELESHGFAKFSIMPKANVAHQTFIRNSASIYFDFNEPVITNTTESQVRLEVGINVHQQLLSYVYPNPSNGNCVIVLESTVDECELQILDLAGRVAKTKQYTNTDRLNIDLSEFTNKVYFYRVKNLDRQVFTQGKIFIAK